MRSVHAGVQPFSFLRQRFSFFDSYVGDLACATDPSP